MASCPRCPHSGLKHTLIQEALPAYACEACDGMLINLVSYRHWRESQPPPYTAPAEAAAALEVADEKDALNCGKCSRVMTKYRISADAPNRIDFCAGCEDIWLDEGEWELVARLAGSQHLANIVTQPWQFRIRSEAAEDMQHARLRDKLGDDFERVHELGEWLDKHAARDTILAYLARRH